MRLQLVCIHSKGASSARKQMHDNFVTLLTSACKKVGGIQLNEPMNITEPTAQHIEANLKEYSDRVDYVKTGDADYDKAMPILNVPQLCNYEKHLFTLRWVERQAMGSTPTHFLVCEDDAAVLPDFMMNMEALLSELKNNPPAYDMILLGLSPASPCDSSAGKWLPATSLCGKFLPSKEAYLIQPAMAAALVKQATPIRFDFRTFLSHAIYTAPPEQSARILAFHKRVCIDGSKLGLCPSMLKNNNLLIFNNEYVQMLHYMNSGEAIDVARVRKMFKPIERLRSPDAMHLYGVLLHKAGRTEEAESMLQDAIDEMIRQGGLINRGSEMMHNYLVIASRKNQEDQHNEFEGARSKYAELYA